MKRRAPPFPHFDKASARVYVGRHAAKDKHGRVRRDAAGKTIWIPDYARRALVGVGAVAFQREKMRELWRVLPWHGTVEWSWDPKLDRLVVMWHSPERSGVLALNKARFE
jgi:hypothetical protein